VGDKTNVIYSQRTQRRVIAIFGITQRFLLQVQPVAGLSRGRERNATIQLAGDLRWACPIGNKMLLLCISLNKNIPPHEVILPIGSADVLIGIYINKLRSNTIVNRFFKLYTFTEE